MWPIVEIVARFVILVLAIVYYVWAYLVLKKAWTSRDWEEFKLCVLSFVVANFMTFHLLWLSFPHWFVQNAQ